MKQSNFDDMKGIDVEKPMTAGQRPSVLPEYSDDNIGNNQDNIYLRLLMQAQTLVHLILKIQLMK
jgi:hypothetical protein